MAKTLVLYYSATNTTKQRAEEVAQRLNADLAAIHPQQPYSAADLNYHDSQSRTSIEQHQHGLRVPVNTADLPNIAGYDNIVIAHPIWWGIPPRFIASTIDHLDLNGKKLATFATSGGSTYDRSQSYIERSVKENHYDVALNQGAVLNSPGEIDGWLQSLNFD